MVMGLLVTLALGMVVIAGTIAWKLSRERAPAKPVAAESLTLPQGETITALGASPSELLVTTRDSSGQERLRVFRRADGKPLSVTTIERGPAEKD